MKVNIIQKIVNLFGGSDFMTLRFDIEKIEELMKSFYTLTGIRFVLFDTEFHEVISYPKESCAFCMLMKGCKQTRRKCNYADRHSFKICEQKNALVLYKCHAGLVEAVMPLHENEKIIGYLMFGQITDRSDKEWLYRRASVLTERYSFDGKALRQSIDQITYKSAAEIDSAAKIMEACTCYILYKELITPENNRIIEAAKVYIEAHLGEDISISSLCEELQISRTKLYEIFRSELQTGIAGYILRRRMHRAKKLLKTTDFPVSRVASAVGFNDYNYFSRVFKKTYGKSPKSYRKIPRDS